MSVNVLCLRTVLADSTDRSLRGMSEPLNGSGHTEMHYQKGSITWKILRDTVNHSKGNFLYIKGIYG